MNPDPFLVIGIIGMLLILLAFIMLQTHRWSPDDFIFDAVNFVGSVCLIAYGIAGKVWPFVILNGIYALYSLRDVFSDVKSRKSTLHGLRERNR